MQRSSCRNATVIIRLLDSFLFRRWQSRKTSRCFRKHLAPKMTYCSSSESICAYVLALRDVCFLCFTAKVCVCVCVCGGGRYSCISRTQNLACWHNSRWPTIVGCVCGLVLVSTVRSDKSMFVRSCVRSPARESVRVCACNVQIRWQHSNKWSYCLGWNSKTSSIREQATSSIHFASSSFWAVSRRSNFENSFSNRECSRWTLNLTIATMATYSKRNLDFTRKRRFLSYIWPQSESWCEAFHMEISFIYMQILVHLHVNKTNFHRLCTRTHFETEAKYNSEIA